MGEYTFKLAQEPTLSAKHDAFRYQLEAVEFVSGRDLSAIFHEQGLGKTKIALDVALLWLQKQEVDAILIVAKKGLVANWQREFQIHTHINPLVLTENSSHNYYVFTTPQVNPLAHYEVVRKEEKPITAWLKTRRVAVFLDEAVKIKNPDADLTQSFFRVAPHFAKRVIMTGTPAANRPFDVWAPIFFLDAGKTLGVDFRSFKRNTDLSKDFHHNPRLLEAYQARLAEVSSKLATCSNSRDKNGWADCSAREGVRSDRLHLGNKTIGPGQQHSRREPDGSAARDQHRHPLRPFILRQRRQQRGPDGGVTQLDLLVVALAPFAGRPACHGCQAMKAMVQPVPAADR